MNSERGMRSPSWIGVKPKLNVSASSCDEKPYSGQGFDAHCSRHYGNAATRPSHQRAGIRHMTASDSRYGTGASASRPCAKPLCTDRCWPRVCPMVSTAAGRAASGRTRACSRPSACWSPPLSPVSARPPCKQPLHTAAQFAGAGAAAAAAGAAAAATTATAGRSSASSAARRWARCSRNSTCRPRPCTASSTSPATRPALTRLKPGTELAFDLPQVRRPAWRAAYVPLRPRRQPSRRAAAWPATRSPRR